MIVCAFALLLAVSGAVVALVAIVRFKRRLNATLAHLNSILDPQRASALAMRLQASIDAVPPLLARANVAIERVNLALNDLRLPQAIAALRGARLAIRLLVSGR